MATLCLGCMRPKESSPICEHCGYDERRENLTHQLPVGTMLQNQYLIGRVLGQGGFGITYLGWDQHLSAPVAIKEYFPSGVVQRHTRMGTDVMLSNGEMPELFQKHSSRFLKEARTLAQLSDIPEIVQIRSFFSQNHTAYIVMEYVQGITLKDHLKKLGRPMTESEALAIMEPVLRALQKVHDHGLIHRDISPDNIMLPKDGGIKLIDFGTVRYVDDSGKSKSTEAVLKPGFAPMEQYNTRGNLGTWTDVYAICATFHYLLTGKVPAEVMERMDQDEQLPLLRSLNISPYVTQALECGMKLRIADRIQTLSELYRRLYTDSHDAYTTQENIQKKPSSGKRKAFLGGLAALLALTTGVFAWKIGNEESKQLSPSSGIVENTPVQNISAAENISSDPEHLYQQALQWSEAGDYAKSAIAFAQLEGYQDSRALSFENWAKVSGRKTISFYDYYDAANNRYIEMIHAIRENGTVVADATFSDSFASDVLSQYAVSSYKEIVSIHGIIGLRFDGTLAIPQTDPKYQQLKSWTNIKALSVYETPGSPSSSWLCVGLRTDGTVVYTGSETFDAKELNRWSDIQAIGCSQDLIVGLKSDRTVVCIGNNKALKDILKEWSDICAIQVSDGQVLGLQTNGNVLSSDSASAVSQWGGKNVVRLADGPSGILADGTILTNDTHISGWNDVLDVTTNSWQSIGLKRDGSLLFTADGYGFYKNAKNWKKILLPDQVIADSQVQYALAQQYESQKEYAAAAITYGKLDDYLDARERSFGLWQKLATKKTIAAGSGCTAMVKDDGTVLSPVVRDNRQYGVSSWKDIQSVSCGYSHTVGLKSDGTLVSINASGVDSQWTDLLAIDASTGTTMGLKSDGTVLSAGPQKSDVSNWKDIVAISASSHAVGLKADGTVVAAGSNQNGQCDVSKWEDIIAISSASYNSTGFTVGLKLDGTVVTAGSFASGQPDVSGWNDIIAVDTGVYENNVFVAGLRSDGTVVISGLPGHDQQTISQWSDIVSISACDSYLLGLKEDGTMVAAGAAAKGETQVSRLSNIMLP